MPADDRDETIASLRALLKNKEHDLADLRRDLRDGREDEHADHAAAFRRLASLALRGAAAAGRRAGSGR